MDYINYLIIVLFLFFMFKRFVPAKGVKHITTTELKAELNNNKNKQFVDVRTVEEYKGNHIKGFKNIPLHELTQQAGRELSKDKEIVLICQSGMRSQGASKILKKLGFPNVTNVKGGMRAWRN
ncbi:rhodanese-like domain-containing protein [Paenibacillus assamensis]|uniref:rhodanese-like domain-containing protein n=1 Tax=Paenibacillus assamensis TaxID=311244 RepID=UPI000411811F|nr:rhodanese-like domain-containing protein [Paenibacillus assamensis]